MHCELASQQEMQAHATKSSSALMSMVWTCLTITWYSRLRPESMSLASTCHSWRPTVTKEGNPGSRA